jgi:hypothetical protein
MSVQEKINVILSLAPFALGVFLAWLTYRYAILQKKYISKQEYYKKIRKGTSNLLALWKDVNRLHSLLIEDSKENQILIESNLALSFLELDVNKIELLEKGFHETTNMIQEIDSVLYSKIEDVFYRFHSTINEVFNPIVFDSKMDYRRKIEIALPVISDLDSELRKDINELIIRLPKNERKKIGKYLKEIVNMREGQKLEVPKFLINFITREFNPQEEFTQDEVITFLSNDTIKWALSKISSTGFYNKLLSGGISNFLTFFTINEKEHENWLDQTFLEKDYINFLNRINITLEEEIRYIRNNKTFYILLLEMIRKIEGNVSMELKRTLVKLNRGDISIREEIEKQKNL